MLDAERHKFNPLDPQLTKNCRAMYEASTMKNAIEYHEFLAIRAYTDDFYRGINPALRSGNSGAWSVLVDSADSGLYKLAHTEEFGYSNKLTRGMSFTGDQNRRNCKQIVSRFW